MAHDLEKQANDAFIDDDFDLAVELYTQAITADPRNSASLLASRAQAHIKLKNFTDAIADANRAIELNPSNSKAFLRKGMACYELEEYATARVAFAAGARLEPSSCLYQSWMHKCDRAIEAENAENTSMGSQPQEEILSESMNGNSLNAGNMSMQPTTQVESKPAQKFSFRHAYYQSTHEVVVEIFAKNLKPEQVKVDFGVQSLRAVIDCPPNEPFTFQTRLNQKVVIEKCKFSILSTKLEIRLAKAESLHWKSLEYSESQMVAPPPAVIKSIMERQLDYPSSSKRGHKNWDKLEAQVKKEEKDEKLEGDAALNKLFRDIYSTADEDTRRAMNKSFVESNGTVLSTNWKDVGKKYVEGSAPSGMEMKKWET